jgi:GNAT superfamily N-acetyltransferase
LPFGVYSGENQIGFARVVTDYATFAYLGDVYILEEFRGRGLSKWLMETIVDHPDLQGFRRWVLATRDAHTLYEKYGFTPLKHPQRWMEKAAPDAY